MFVKSPEVYPIDPISPKRLLLPHGRGLRGDSQGMKFQGAVLMEESSSVKATGVIALLIHDDINYYIIYLYIIYILRNTYIIYTYLDTIYIYITMIAYLEYARFQPYGCGRKKNT